MTQLMLSCLGYTDDDSIDCRCIDPNCPHGDGTCCDVGYCIRRTEIPEDSWRHDE